MSHCQIPPPPPTIEDTMDDVTLTHYNHVDSTSTFEGCQEGLQGGLPALLQWCPALGAAAPSTASTTEVVIYTIALQLQLQRHEGKGLLQSQDPTLSNAELYGMPTQLQHLRQEKEAPLVQVQRFPTQEAVNTGPL